METLFSGQAQIAIQGNNPLKFIALYPEYAEYHLGGFTKKTIQILDFRSICEKLVSRYLFIEEKRRLFMRRFCIPSSVSVIQKNNNYMSIKLLDLKDQKVDHWLWVAIGADEVPFYDYQVIEKEILDPSVYGDSIALFSVFKLRNSEAAEKVTSSV